MRQTLLTGNVKYVGCFQMVDRGTQVGELRNVKNTLTMSNIWLSMATPNLTKCTCLRNCNKARQSCKQRVDQTNTWTTKTPHGQIDEQLKTVSIVTIQYQNPLVGHEGIVTVCGQDLDRLQKMVSAWL